MLRQDRDGREVKGKTEGGGMDEGQAGVGREAGRRKGQLKQFRPSPSNEEQIRRASLAPSLKHIPEGPH